MGKVFGPTLGEGVITCIFSMFWFRFNELGLFNVSRVPKYRLSHLGRQPLFHPVDAAQVALPPPLVPGPKPQPTAPSAARPQMQRPPSAPALAAPALAAPAVAHMPPRAQDAANAANAANAVHAAPAAGTGADAGHAAHTGQAPRWVERACELLVKGKVTVPMVALQVRRAAAKSSDTIDANGFDMLLEMQEERGLRAERILELQDELGF